MGIAVKELLTLEYFKDYHVIAGKSGLHKEIQGTTLLEAPDALRWAKGKELVLSSGYVLAQEPDCLEEAFKSGSMQGTSAMMIKRGRYLDEIPQRLIDLFDQYEIPLISMPIFCSMDGIDESDQYRSDEPNDPKIQSPQQ